MLATTTTAGNSEGGVRLDFVFLKQGNWTAQMFSTSFFFFRERFLKTESIVDLLRDSGQVACNFLSVNVFTVISNYK